MAYKRFIISYIYKHVMMSDCDMSWDENILNIGEKYRRICYILFTALSSAETTCWTSFKCVLLVYMTMTTSLFTWLIWKNNALLMNYYVIFNWVLWLKSFHLLLCHSYSMMTAQPTIIQTSSFLPSMFYTTPLLLTVIGKLEPAL